MRARRGAVIGAGALIVAAAAMGGAIARSGGARDDAVTSGPVTSTAAVERGSLAAVVSLDGTLTYRARPDGSPFVAVNQASGTFTRLPEAGDRVGCGEVLYRVDERPVLLLCGEVPGYRPLGAGDSGADVQELNANLHDQGLDEVVGVAIDPNDASFTDRTALAVARLQAERGLEPTGSLRLGDVVVLPSAVRVSGVEVGLGRAARPGSPVLAATSDELEVRVDLDASQQGEVEVGDHATITLPTNTVVAGTVERVGRAAATQPDGGGGPAGATVASLRLDDREPASRLDASPVRVQIATGGVEDVVSVPVLAVVGRSGGGYAVEVVGPGGRRHLVEVELGLIDVTAGRVQVDGDVQPGDRVVVPSS